jgi:hypothetical protein
MSLDRTERTGLTGHDSGIIRIVDKGVWGEQRKQDSWDTAAGTGQLGRDDRDRTVVAGQPGQEIWDRKVRKTDG